MSKVEKVVLWVVWAIVVMIAAVPLVWFGSLALQADNQTNPAMAMTQADMFIVIAAISGVVSLSVWTYRRTRKKPS